MLVTVLQMQGHETFEAASGSEALEVAARVLPDVVLLDIGLPDRSGYDVGRELRALLGRRSRLIALTGYGQPDDRARSQAADFDAHLVKPVEPQRLAEILQAPARETAAR
jgi:CheY-like chemotaxis protein